MSENPTPYGTRPTAATESRTAELVALAHASRQGVPYESSTRLLAQLPERLHALAELVLGGKMGTEEIAYALDALGIARYLVPHAPIEIAPSGGFSQRGHPDGGTRSILQWNGSPKLGRVGRMPMAPLLKVEGDTCL